MTEITFNEKELKKIRKEINHIQHHIYVLKNALKLSCEI